MPIARELTPKQKMFVAEYLVDLNATQAAIRAGYSPKRAMEIGYQLLHKTTMQAALKVAMDNRAARTGITADRVLKEYAKIGFADIKDFLSFGTVKTEVDWDADANKPIFGYKQVVEAKPSDEVDGTLINEVSINRDGTFKFKLHDKKGALDMIGKHLGMFTENLNVTGELAVKIIDDIEK